MFTALGLKNKLIKVFRAGELYLKYKNGSTTQRIYPKIHSARVYGNYTQYVFTCPMGLNPADILKKQWLFENVFGENIDMAQENKKITLTVYHEALPAELIYDYLQYENELAHYGLPILCGFDKHNKIVAYDMVEHPHLLIGGETGSGKSCQVRSVLCTLIQSCSPDELHFHLGDLKRSEFHLFRNVEHVKSVSVTKPALNNILVDVDNELRRRGSLLDKHEVMHVNQLPKDIRPPFIIVAIDEVALLKNEKETMSILEDISSVGRSLGIFLINSLQRPDSKILDGALKNNLTVRMGFRTADAINSRIIGTKGADKITQEERGRFILKMEKLHEIQAPYLSDKQAKEILRSFICDKPKVAVSDDTELLEVSDNNEETIESIFGTLEGLDNESER